MCCILCSCEIGTNKSFQKHSSDGPKYKYYDMNHNREEFNGFLHNISCLLSRRPEGLLELKHLKDNGSGKPFYSVLSTKRPLGENAMACADTCVA